MVWCVQAATAVDEAKVRQQVGQIADEALQALDHLDERMAEARWVPWAESICSGGKFLSCPDTLF
jgi:hypothetical protein